MTYTQGVKEQILKYSYKSEDEWAAEMAAVCLCSGYDWDREKDRVKILCTTEDTAKRLVRDAKMSGTGLVADGPERVGRRGGSVFEVLFAAGELKVLHSYAVERYMAIYDVRFCTGMIPLAKKLFKAGDPLAACIFMRGAIYYLMGMGNSRYYNDVHAHRRTLAEMAASVKDWETVEPQSSFDSDFAADFANRRTFWF